MSDQSAPVDSEDIAEVDKRGNCTACGAWVGDDADVCPSCDRAIFHPQQEE